MQHLSNFAALCSAGDGGNLLGLPTWYKYLQCDEATGNVQGFEIGQVWLILAAVLEMLLMLGAIIAVIFVIIGGFKMLTSSGNPDRVSSARQTIINALIGLVIMILATSAVSFLAGRLAENASGSQNTNTQEQEETDSQIPEGAD